VQVLFLISGVIASWFVSVEASNYILYQLVIAVCLVALCAAALVAALGRKNWQAA
jgi:hypothetical protein